MERATALARLYESVNTIPEDIQQSLLQIAQYGCDPEQVKRWYVLVREHFGAPGAQSAGTANPQAASSTSPSHGIEVSVEVPSLSSLGRPASRSSRGRASGRQAQTSGGAPGRSGRMAQEPPQTPPTNTGGLPWNSPCSVPSRTDSGHAPMTVYQPADPTGMMGPSPDEWSHFVHSPDTIMGPAGNSPGFIDPNTQHGQQPSINHFSNPTLSPTDYGLSMKPAPMSSVGPPDETLAPTPALGQTQFIPSQPSNRSQTPGVQSGTAKAGTSKRRRPHRKSVREMMEQHQQYQQQRRANQARPNVRTNDMFFDLTPPPPAPLPMHPHPHPHSPFYPPMPTDAPRSTAQMQHPNTTMPMENASSLRPFPQPQIVNPQNTPNFQGSQSCPLPQQPFGAEMYPSYFSHENTNPDMS